MKNIDDIEAYEKSLYEFLDDKDYNDQRHETIFTLSTRSPNSPDIVELKEAIQDLMEEEKYPMPLVWFNLKQQIQKQGKKILTLPELQKIAEKIQIHDTKQVEAALAFFHAVGDLVFFKELQNCIVTDPQWLIDQFKKIITIKTNKNPRCSALWVQLDKFGYLRGKLMEEIWPDDNEREHMTELMKRFALLLPIQNYLPREPSLKRPDLKKAEKAYLVPCLLPPADKKQEESDEHPLLLKPLCDDFIPAGLIGRLVSSLCIEDGWEICGEAYADVVTLELVGSFQIKLCTKLSPKRIEIRCTRTITKPDKPLSESLLRIAERIGNLPGNVGFDVCIPCTHVEKMTRLKELCMIHKVAEENPYIYDRNGPRLRDSEYSAWFFDLTSTGRKAFHINLCPVSSIHYVIHSNIYCLCHLLPSC